MGHQQTSALSLLGALQLTQDHIANLPPDLRDQLLDYLRLWGSPEEHLALVERLRELHGPLLLLLDHQAQAYLRLGDYAQALDTIERRQHRSTTLASQVLEAKALLGLGHGAHAQAVADDLQDAYPRHTLAVCAAAEIYTHLGQFPRARDLLEHFLEIREPSSRANLQATLTLARLAHQAGERELAEAYVQRLGSGVPPGLGPASLQELAGLLADLGHQQSAQAVQLELERQRQRRFQELQERLGPLVNVDPDLVQDPARLYRHLSGPESIQVSRAERRRIQLEAIRHFGFSELRTGQAEVIAAVLRGESILAVMPTGAGKSLCYQLPALIQPRATLVISPLIALMKDQVESLPAGARRRATFINSSLSDEEYEARMQGIARGDYKLIYAAPERLRQITFLHALRDVGLDLFVVDEAHCVSLWGHDFRPDYLFIQEARRELGNPPALAMTATAPPRVRDEIIDYMQIEETAGEGEGDGEPERSRRPRVMALDIFRENLFLSALHFHHEEEKVAALLQFVAETEGSGIVYVNSRHKSEALAFQLRQAGVAAEAYHAGLADRSAVQDRFMSDRTRVVVATVAFGMGIDKPDIRFIVHFHPPQSLAAYYQEVGRAGRDGRPSQGILFYSNNDWANLRRWAKADEFTVDFLEKVYQAVSTQLAVNLSMAGQEVDQEPGEAGIVDMRRLQQVLNSDETSLRVAISMLERCDLMTRGFDVPQEFTIAMPRRQPTPPDDEDFRYLMAGLALRPGEVASFKARDIGAFMGWPLHLVESRLLAWQRQGWLRVKASQRAMYIEVARRPADMRDRLERMLAQSAAIAQRRIDDVVGYATTDGCRHGYISAHFGSPPRNRCTVCDNCTGVRPNILVPTEAAPALPDDADIEPMIIDCLLSLPKPVGRSGLARILAGSLRAPVPPDQARHHGRLKALGEATIMGYIDDLLADHRLRQYERHGYPVLAPTRRGRAEAESWLAEHPELAELPAAPAAAGDAPPQPPPQPEEAEREGDRYTALQKALWLWRRRCAEELGQPPYMIMSNELMLRIAETRPQTEEELAALPGMGEQRLQHFGPTILDLVRLYPKGEKDDELLRAQRAEEARLAAPGPLPPRVQRQLYLKLQELRQKLSVQEGCPPSRLAGTSLLKALAHQAPTNLDELRQVAGFEESGLAPYAPLVLAVISQIRNGASTKTP